MKLNIKTINIILNIEIIIFLNIIDIFNIIKEELIIDILHLSIILEYLIIVS